LSRERITIAVVTLFTKGNTRKVIKPVYLRASSTIFA